MRYINEGLARLISPQKAEPMEFVLDRERGQAAGSFRTYLMISKNQKQECYESFLKMVGEGAGSLWIATLYPEMDLRLPGKENCPVLRWEVKK